VTVAVIGNLIEVDGQICAHRLARSKTNQTGTDIMSALTNPSSGAVLKNALIRRARAAPYKLQGGTVCSAG
jgi:hypothetical protein